LLYAKTNEAIIPDNDSIIIGKSRISIGTLDLSGRFEVIKSQLDEIAKTLTNTEMVIAV